MNVALTLSDAAKRLRTSQTPSLDARLLLAHVLQRDAAWLVAHRDGELEAGELERFAAAVARRAAGEPLAYVVGEAWFFGRPFVVTPDVLVPRPETENVVAAALDDLRARARRTRTGVRACDVGTGSGAIALTLAAEMPALDVVACDASEAALRVAGTNARRLGLATRVQFVGGDLEAPLVDHGPYDCVVANLPYVPSAQVPVRPDPVGFEPRLAVDGGADGLDLYRRLAAALPRLLTPQGSAFFEAAPPTIDALAACVMAALPGAHVEIGEDAAGLDRWVAVSL